MRDRILTAAIYGLFALIVAGLFCTQVLMYFHYSRLSKNNVIRIIPIDGPRGIIYDRNGSVLVTNRLSFDVAVVYQELRDAKELSDLLSRTLGVSGHDILAALDRAAGRPYAPVTIVEDIDKDKALLLDEASSDVRGLVIETRSRRSYPYGEAGCHLFGYLSEVTEQELERLRDYGYRMRDLIGKSGLEKRYNGYLAGVDGGVQIQVDNRGRQAKVLGLKEPESGKDIHLTVDADLQLVCDKILSGRKGAAIVVDPVTGEVLALASHPAFDPNVFAKPNTSDERMRLLRDRKSHPLIDRAISGLYAPGSVFKVVTASAALETRKINSSTTFNCTGSYRLGRGKFDCWKEGGHGPQDIVAGIMNSCNVFFYNTGRLAGVDAIEAYAKLYGFGRPTGIDLPDEAAGLVPGRLWKRLRKNEAWYEGETINYAIGQGYLLVTPMQLLQMMAAVANNGAIVSPYIVKRIDKKDVARRHSRNLGLRASTLRLIREGLYKVVNGETGTAKRVQIKGVAIAGKTGTAQNPQGETHAWFAGFAPFEKPKICVLVFLEHGGHGAQAAELARSVFEKAREKGYL